jgi:cell fate (sporulation/competence/biofilm development) regulator YmcA (YheA/YmcA/DUF963 family)
VNVTQLAKNEISSLTKKDAVIIWGGANDISRNATMKGLKVLHDFVNQRSNISIIIVTAPHRHDLLAESCVNSEVKTFKRKLFKIMKTRSGVRILHHRYQREDFTKHGLHLNAVGKIKAVKLMSQNIDQLLNSKKNHPIVLKRKSHPNIKEGNNIVTIFGEDLKDSYSQGGKGEQKEMDIETVRISNRLKKTPVNRSDDFFYGCKFKQS